MTGSLQEGLKGESSLLADKSNSEKNDSPLNKMMKNIES